MNKNLVLTSSPHLRDNSSTSVIMRDVLIALMPAFAASVYFFGLNALLLSAACVAACIFFEWAYRKSLGLTNTAGDLSAAVTGLLLAFNLPSSMPIWMAVIGCFVAIVIVKQLFGGLGKNFANPAIVARITLMTSFATEMTTWPAVRDAVTQATPLAAQVGAFSYLDLLIGNVGGSMGETSAIALLIGGVYLVYRGVITVTTPAAFLGTMAVLSLVLGGDPLYQLLAGGAILGAVFMATDYSTSPITERGKIIFGIGCGVLTIIIRFYGVFPEGVSFAILLMNIVTPHIDRLTTTKAFGGIKNR